MHSTHLALLFYHTSFTCLLSHSGLQPAPLCWGGPVPAQRRVLARLVREARVRGPLPDLHQPRAPGGQVPRAQRALSRQEEDQVKCEQRETVCSQIYFFLILSGERNSSPMS